MLTLCDIVMLKSNKYITMFDLNGNSDLSFVWLALFYTPISFSFFFFMDEMV